MVRGEKNLAALASRFVCVRVTDMRGVDLSTFQFDYDVSWAAFLMNAEGRIYSRVFGRNERSAMAYLSMDALQNTMKAALKIHEEEARSKPEARPPARWKTVEDIPAYAKFKGRGCVHCHMVNDFDRRQAWVDKTFTKELFRNYPPPENWGLKLERSDSSQIKSVKASSFAEEAGLKPGDVLRKVNDVRILSPGDLFFAMNFAAEKGAAKIVFERDGKEQSATLRHEGDWRKSDISWRQSIWSSGLQPGLFAAPLDAERKKKLELAPNALAMSVQFVQPDSPADRAGVKTNDIITAIGGETKSMDLAHFQAYFRSEFNPGDAVELTLLRDGQAVKTELRFPK